MMESVVRLATTANYLLLVSAFCPGLAMLRFAKKSNWSIVPTMAAVILILVPATVIASSHHLLDPTWKEIHHEVAYAVWPLPGVIVLLNKWSKKGPRLGATSSVLYLLPYLVASIPLYFFGMRSLANPTVSCIAAIVVILFFRSDKLLFAARSVGVVLLLLPVAAPFLVRLPEHVAMAKACESEAGTSINVTPVPTDVIALELGQDGCDRLCRELLKTKSVAAVETSWMGGGTGTMSHPAGLYRYEFGPFISSGATPSAQGEDDRFCYQQITWGGVPDCIFAMPISDYAARYAIGLGGGVPNPRASGRIRSKSSTGRTARSSRGRKPIS